MEYRTVGRTELKVSNISLGTMTWGRQNSEQEAHEQLDYALAQGVNFVDTAEMYAVPSGPEFAGKTEEIIGNWFSQNRRRDEVILATKVVGVSNFEWLRDGISETRHNREQITYALEQSLRRLQTDYIDVYYLHWPDRRINLFMKSRGYEHSHDPNATPIEEIMEVLDGFVKQGKIRHVALSNETPWGLTQYLNQAEQVGRPRVGLVQNAYSLVNRLYEHGLAEYSYRENVGLAAYSPLAGGALSGKYREGALPLKSRRELFPDFTTRYKGLETEKAIDEYYKLASDHGLTLTQLAQKFVDSRPFVTTSIIGATTMDQLKENIAAFDTEWSDELEAGVNDIHKRIPSPAP